MNALLDFRDVTVNSTSTIASPTAATMVGFAMILLMALNVHALMERTAFVARQIWMTVLKVPATMEERASTRLEVMNANADQDMSVHAAREM